MQRKIHNQTLFVAALSVYLGLLIVGAPPQVLAQTLKAQEVLDCGETSEDVRQLRSIQLVEPLQKLAEDLQKLIQIHKLDFKYNDSHYYFSQDFIQTETGTVHSATRSSNRWIDLVFQNFVEEARDSGLAALPDFFTDTKSKIREKHQSFNVVITKSGFEISVSFKKASSDQATAIADNLRQAFFVNGCEETRPQAKQVYENTKVTVENDQIFIVTRLPRAGLDALIKADEKAN